MNAFATLSDSKIEVLSDSNIEILSQSEFMLCESGELEVSIDVWEDSFNVVEECLAAVRETARLDVEPVLPPLSARMQVAPSPVNPFSPTSVPGLLSVPRVRPPWPPSGVSDDTARRNKKTALNKRDREKGSSRLAQFPLFICGFVASVAAGAALMASPVGHRPEVQRGRAVAEQVAHDVTANAEKATKSVSRLFAR